MNNFLPGEIGGLPVRRAGYDIFEDLPGYQPKPSFGGIFDDPAFQFGLSVLANNTSKNPAQALMGGMRGLQDFQKQKSADAYNLQMQQYNMTQAETARMKAITDRKKLMDQQKAAQAEGKMFLPGFLKASGIQPQGFDIDDEGNLVATEAANVMNAGAESAPNGFLSTLDHDMRAALEAGLADPKTRGIAYRQMFDMYKGQKKQGAEFTGKLGQAMQFASMTPEQRAAVEKYNEVFGSKGQSININVMPGEAAKAAGKKEGFEIGEQAAMIENKYSAIDSVREAKDMLRQGIYTGYWADVGKTLAKASMGAVGDRQKAARTEQFMSYIGNTVVPRLKEFGGNDSNDEMRYLQKIMGGDITMEPEAISAILESAERKISRGIERLQRQRGALEKGKMPDLGPGPARGQTKPTKPADLKAAPSVDDLLKKYGGK